MKASLPIKLFVIFVVINILLRIFHNARPEYDYVALVVANMILFLLSIGSWALMRKKATERAQVFVRGVYGATMLRLFICIIGVLAYALINKEHIHRPTLFVMFGIYIVYTTVETIYFSKQTKQGS